jgi:ankyrin repeat protein
VFCLQSGNSARAKELLSQSDINSSLNDFGDTALHYCCHIGFQEVLDWLLGKEGIDIHKQNKQGWTAIDIAHSNGQQQIEKKLEARGAELSKDVPCVFQSESN